MCVDCLHAALENRICEGREWGVLDDVYLPERIKKPRLTAQREPNELSELSLWKCERGLVWDVFDDRVCSCVGVCLHRTEDSQGLRLWLIGRATYMHDVQDHPQ